MSIYINGEDIHPYTLALMLPIVRHLTQSSVGPHLILRGGLALRLWIGEAKRPIQDIDFLTDLDLCDEQTNLSFQKQILQTLHHDPLSRSFANPAQETCSADDFDCELPAYFPVFSQENPAGEQPAKQAGKQAAKTSNMILKVSVTSYTTIWRETKNPGLRFFLSVAVVPIEGTHTQIPFANPVSMQLDVGSGDPVNPPPVLYSYPVDGNTQDSSDTFAIRVVGPATLIGWKLHGLYERGGGKWRPKDLLDLLLLFQARRETLASSETPTQIHTQIHAIQTATQLAFQSRGDSILLLDRILDGTFGSSPWSKHKWAAFRRDNPHMTGVDQYPQVEDAVRALRMYLDPIFSELVAQEKQNFLQKLAVPMP